MVTSSRRERSASWESHRSLRMRGFLGIRAQLLLLVAVAALPGGALLLHAVAAQRDALAQDIQGDLERTALLAAERTRGAIEEAHGALDAFASLEAVRLRDEAACSAAARSITATEPAFTNVSAATPDGNVFCSALPVRGSVSLADRAYFQAALRAPDVVVGDYVVGRLSGRPVLPLARALLGNRGEKLGVANLYFDLSHLDQLLAGIERRPGVVLTAIDSTGTILGRHPDLQRRPVSAIDGPRLKQMLEQRKGADELRGVDGVRRIHAFTEVRAGGSPAGILISAGIPRDLAMAGVNRLFARSLLIYAVVGVLVLGAAWLAGEFGFNRRLLRLANAARLVQAGDLRARCGAKNGGDEISLVASAFDEMAHGLEALTRQNRLILESAGVGIYGVDREGLITFVNPAAVEMLGYAPPELLGRRSHGLIHSEAACGPDSKCPILATLRDGSRHHTEGELFVRKDATTIPVDTISTPIREGSELTGAVIAFRDVRRRKEMEAQLAHAQKMEAVGRLAGGVAHDFNNLLTVILSCAEVLKDDLHAGPPGQLELAEEIQAAGKRASELTRQLLAFARRQVIEPVVLDLNSIVRGSEKMLRRVLDENIEVVVRLQPNIWAVRCDPGQIDQVILNLAVNARDAMPNGGRLTIETANAQVGDNLVALHPFMRTGPHVRLTIRDTGVGMTPEVKAHAFEPFFTTKTQGKGTGLGLAMIYGFVKQSEGYILLESEVGRGTSLYLYFPRTSEATVTAPAPPKTTRGGTETVLLVEDDPQVREITLRALRAAGYRVIVACDAAEALEAAAKEAGALDLLLSDVIMPGPNGHELGQELCRSHPDLRVLYMSGYTQDIISKAGVLDSGIEFLPKPFTAALLQERVRKVLDAGSTEKLANGISDIDSVVVE
jgi:PAS domain S-box-containing protein